MALLPRAAGGSGGGGTGGGTTDHNVLINRDLSNQHPQSAISGLEDRLNAMAQHSALSGRDQVNQHPITAITGLSDALKPLSYEGVFASLADAIAAITNPSLGDYITIVNNDGTTSMYYWNGTEWTDSEVAGPWVESVNGKVGPNVNLTPADLGAEAAGNKGVANGYAPLGPDMVVPAANLPPAQTGLELQANKGQPDGYAPLNSDGKVPAQYLTGGGGGGGTSDHNLLLNREADNQHPTSAIGNLDNTLSTMAARTETVNTNAQNAISQEATTRANADTSNATAISTEATTRATADTTEQQARIAGDNALQSKIDAVTGKLRYLPPNDFTTATPAQADLTSYATGHTGLTDVENGTTVVNLFDNVEWIYDEASTTWINNGLNNVSQSTNASLGVVKGAIGYLYEADGATFSETIHKGNINDDGTISSNVFEDNLFLKEGDQDDVVQYNGKNLAHALIRGALPLNSDGSENPKYMNPNIDNPFVTDEVSAARAPLIGSLITSTLILPVTTGYVPADGSLLSRTAYPELWAACQASAIDDTTWLGLQTSDGEVGKYSTGDGSTTFRVPLINGIGKNSQTPGAITPPSGGGSSGPAADGIGPGYLVTVTSSNSAFYLPKSGYWKCTAVGAGGAAGSAGYSTMAGSGGGGAVISNIKYLLKTTPLYIIVGAASSNPNSQTGAGGAGGGYTQIQSTGPLLNIAAAGGGSGGGGAAFNAAAANAAWAGPGGGGAGGIIGAQPGGAGGTASASYGSSGGQSINGTGFFAEGGAGPSSQSASSGTQAKKGEDGHGSIGGDAGGYSSNKGARGLSLITQGYGRGGVLNFPATPGVAIFEFVSEGA